MNGTGLLPAERLAVDRLAAELARLVQDHAVANKAPARRAALVRLLWLLGDEGLLGPEPVAREGEEASR
jgi:hypothetical protein